jgi:hypothetical protein
MTKLGFTSLILLFVVICLAKVSWSQIADPINGSVTFIGPTKCGAIGIGNSSCYSLTVQCSGIDGSGVGPVGITLKVTNPGSSRGTVLFTDAGGSSTWFEGQFAFGPMMMNTLVKAGFTVVQAEFSGSLGYLTGPAPNGVRSLACRYAALANWIFASTGPLIHPSNTAMCAAGLSGGSSAVGYALAHFGMGTGATRIFDMVEVISGPTLTRIDHACICDQPPLPTNTGQTNLSECLLAAKSLIDGTYPSPVCTTAGKTHSLSNATLLQHDSILSDDPPFLNYSTNVHVLFGGQDQSAGPAQGLDWVNAVTSPLTVATVLDAGHFLPDSFAGAVQVVNDLTGSCSLLPPAGKMIQY